MLSFQEPLLSWFSFHSLGFMHFDLYSLLFLTNFLVIAGNWFVSLPFGRAGPLNEVGAPPYGHRVEPLSLAPLRHVASGSHGPPADLRTCGPCWSLQAGPGLFAALWEPGVGSVGWVLMSQHQARTW